MLRRGQVTIFIIVAIVIVLGAVLFFVFRDSNNLDSSSASQKLLNSQAVLITDSISQCLEIISLDGIRLLGIQGGYIFPPENSIKTNFSTIAYAHYFNNNLLISTDSMQKELNSYVELSMPLCFDGTLFEEFEVSFGEIKSDSRIESNIVKVFIDYPISISIDSSRRNLDREYRAVIPIELGAMHEKANELIEEEMENPFHISLTGLSDSDYEVSVLSYNEKVLIYSITDENLEDEAPYSFMFARRLG
jgi:hypothetical protein